MKGNSPCRSEQIDRQLIDGRSARSSPPKNRRVFHDEETYFNGCNKLAVSVHTLDGKVLCALFSSNFEKYIILLSQLSFSTKASGWIQIIM